MHLFAIVLVETYADFHDVTQAAVIIADALRNPNKARPTGELFVGTVAQQWVFKKKKSTVTDDNHGRFWARFIEVASVTAQRRFIDVFSRYLEGVVEQARRQTQGIPSIDDYLIVRRQDIGAYPCFPLIEPAFNLKLPDEVLYHPVMVELSRLAVDMIIFDNVCCSLPPECIHGIWYNGFI